ncbi:MAG: RNA polymerase sigma factor [Hyphomicrobiales bacterium]
MINEEFDKLYEEFYSKVYRLCLGYSKGDEDLAKDLSQEVFIAVLNKMHSFRRESKISTWIYRITVNVCLMYLRKDNTRSEHIDAYSLIDNQEEKTENIKVVLLRKCINELTEPDQMIVMLMLEGETNADIADIMEIKEGSIRVRIHRFKEKLRNCIEHYERSTRNMEYSGY